jgi:hypothetical protein
MSFRLNGVLYPARRFHYYVNGVRYRLALHTGTMVAHGWTISAWATGRPVTHCKSGELADALRTLDTFAMHHGANDLQRAIENAST